MQSHSPPLPYDIHGCFQIDLVDQAVVAADEVEDLARELGVKLYRACAKENLNVSETFLYLADLHQRKAGGGGLVGQAAHMGCSATAAAATPSSTATPSSVTPHKHNANSLFESDDVLKPRLSAGHGGARTINVLPTGKQRTDGKKKLKDKLSSKICVIS